MKNTFIIGIIIYFISFNIFTQDILVKKDGEKLNVIVKKVDKNSIEYYNFEDPNKTIFKLDKALIISIDFAYGNKLDIENPENDFYYYSDNKINNLQVNFSSLSNNTLGVSYEKALQPKKSILAELKIYGIGSKSFLEVNRSGFGIDFSYRLKVKSLFEKKSYEPKHILSGPYFSPLLGFSLGSIKEEYIFSDGIYKSSHKIIHFGLQYGKQWIFKNSMSLDASIGYHYYIGKLSSDNSNNIDYSDITLRLGNMVGSNDKLFSFNLRFGFLFGKEKLLNNKKTKK